MPLQVQARAERLHSTPPLEQPGGRFRLWVVSSSYPAFPGESINAGVLARDVALWTHEQGCAVTVVTPQKPEGLRVDAGLESIPLAWFRPTKAMSDLTPRRPIDLVRIFSLMALARPRLFAAARRQRPDGILALWALPCGIFARSVRRRFGTPYAVWLLGSDVWKADRFPGGVRALRYVLADAAGRFADGSDLARRAEELTGIGVEFLPSIRRLPPPSGEAAPCDVLFVGRYHPNKGPDVLLEAFAQVIAQRPGTTLRMHGLGEMRPQLEAIVRELGLSTSVAVGGPLDASALAAALRATKVLAIPSRIESIPLVLGDAAQAGTRVVATEVGDMGEVVRSNALGTAVPAEDPQRLAEALLGALAEPRSVDPVPSSFRPDSVFSRLLQSVHSTTGGRA